MPNILPPFFSYFHFLHTYCKGIHYYYLDEIIDEFLYYMTEDIIKTYGKENLYKCKKFLRNKLNNNEEYLYNKYGEDENN